MLMGFVKQNTLNTQQITSTKSNQNEIVCAHTISKEKMLKR